MILYNGFVIFMNKNMSFFKMQNLKINLNIFIPVYIKIYLI